MQDLQDLFEKQGAMVTYIHMPVFEDSKRCRGFAQVTFTKREYVDVACEMDGSKLKGGRWLSVKRLDKSKVKKNKGKKAKSKQATEKDETAENDSKYTCSFCCIQGTFLCIYCYLVYQYLICLKSI